MFKNYLKYLNKLFPHKNNLPFVLELNMYVDLE